MRTYITVSPAYGRDYRNAKSAIADWKAGKDFKKQPEGCYTSIRDWTDAVINIRYNHMEKVAVV